MSYQVEMVNLEELVSSTHQYRQFSKVFDFSEIEKSLNSMGLLQDKVKAQKFLILLIESIFLRKRGQNSVSVG